MSSANRPDFLQVVMLGDSITWSSQVPFGKRYGDFIETELQARLGGRVVVDVAVCGDGSDTTGQGLERLERDCLAYEPHLVLLNLACNNMLRETDYIETELRTIIERIRARCPATRIIPETIPTVDEKRHAWRRHPEILKAGGLKKVCEVRVHDIIRRLAREYGLTVHDRFRDFHRALAKRAEVNKKLICADGVHQTAAGNRYFARSAARLLAEAVILPPVTSKRPAAAWLALAEQNPAYQHGCHCLDHGGLAQFLRTSGSWSRLMFQQARSFARRAACMASHPSVKSRALTVAALAAAFSALQRALPYEIHQNPSAGNLRWLLKQIQPYMQDKRMRRLAVLVRRSLRQPFKA